jgi:hypothetical protein
MARLSDLKSQLELIAESFRGSDQVKPPSSFKRSAGLHFKSYTIMAAEAANARSGSEAH